MYHSVWVEGRTDLTHTQFQQHVPVVIESSANMPHQSKLVTSANPLSCFRPAKTDSSISQWFSSVYNYNYRRNPQMIKVAFKGKVQSLHEFQEPLDPQPLQSFKKNTLNRIKETL